MAASDVAAAARKLADRFVTFCSGPDEVVMPAGYRDSGIAVIDAVFSMQAHYSGATSAVRRYAQWAGLDATPGLSTEGGVDQHSVEDLRRRIKDLDAEHLAEAVFGNRSRQGTTNRLKAELVQDVAGALCEAGVADRGDVAQLTDHEDYEHQKQAWTDVRGLGRVTFEYFRMLCGAESSKPDVMVVGWLEDVLGYRPSTQEALDLLVALTAELSDRWGRQLSVRGVDHTIWRHQSGRASGVDDGDEC